MAASLIGQTRWHIAVTEPEEQPKLTSWRARRSRRVTGRIALTGLSHVVRFGRIRRRSRLAAIPTATAQQKIPIQLAGKMRSWYRFNPSLDTSVVYTHFALDNKIFLPRRFLQANRESRLRGTDGRGILRSASSRYCFNLSDYIRGILNPDRQSDKSVLT